MPSLSAKRLVSSDPAPSELVPNSLATAYRVPADRLRLVVAGVDPRQRNLAELP